MFEFCTAVNAEMSTWGACLSEAFLGNTVFAIIGLFFILGYVAYKFNMPHEVSIVMGVGAAFMIGLIYGGELLTSLMAIVFIVVAVYFVRAMLKPGKK